MKNQPCPVVAFVPREVFSTTQRSLETLFERTKEPFELVCIDGNSPPEVAQFLAEAAARWNFTLLRSDAYLTPNQARNLAADWALKNTETRHIAFVDNDVLVQPGWLQALVDCSEETGAWVVGPMYFEHQPECHRLHMYGGECRITTDEQGRRRYHEQHYLPHRTLDSIEEQLTRRETELIEFHTVLVRREVFEQLGPLDEGLMSTAEHGDLCLTVREAGQSVWLEPDAKITYAPPRQLATEDREFFFLRWSEAWSRETLNHLAAKWGLEPVNFRRDSRMKWLRMHRRYGLAVARWLKKTLGPRYGRKIGKRVVGPIDRLLNERRYPLSTYGKASPPRTRVISTPAATTRKVRLAA